jgi:hypothetical protein
VLADARRLAQDVEARDARGALVRSEQGGQDSKGPAGIATIGEACTVPATVVLVGCSSRTKRPPCQ